MSQEFQFLLAALAVWRVVRIWTMERGPWDVFDRARIRLGVNKGETWIQHGLGCMACISFWAGLIVSAILGGDVQTVVLRGLAIGAVSVILMRRVN